MKSKLFIDLKECCGAKHQADGIYFLYADGELVWHSSSYITPLSYFTCGDATYGTISICKLCAVKFGLEW